MRAEQQYIDLFSQCEAMICRHSAEVLNAPRAQAFADFEKLGFPTRKQEKYKYTDVSKLFEPDYGLNLNRLDIPVNPYEVFKCDVPNMSTALYFVVNDAFYRKALPKAQLPEGVLLGSLKELSEQYPALVKQYYGKLADTSKDGVTAFNTTFAQDGFMLYVPKGVVVDKPIQLVNILRADVNFMVNRRVLVVLEEGAQARLLICDHAMDNVNFLSTQVIEVFAKENATFDLYELEGRVDDLYFGILLLDERIAQTNLTLNLLRSNLEKVRALQRNGVAMQSDADVLEAELLSVGQQLIQFESSCDSYRRMLGIFIGQRVGDRKLQRPSAVQPLSGESARPELAMFAAKIDRLTAQEKMVKSSSMPRLGFFAQGYYGYPGLDYMQSMMNNDWSWNAMLGVKLSWNFGAYYTQKNNLNKLRTSRQQVEVQRDVFLFNMNLQAAQENGDIARLRKAIADDDRIVALRRSVREAAESKLRNGIIDTHDLSKITDESTASMARSMREIELLKAIYEYKHTINR